MSATYNRDMNNTSNKADQIIKKLRRASILSDSLREQLETHCKEIFEYTATPIALDITAVEARENDCDYFRRYELEVPLDEPFRIIVQASGAGHNGAGAWAVVDNRRTVDGELTNEGPHILIG